MRNRYVAILYLFPLELIDSVAFVSFSHTWILFVNLRHALHHYYYTILYIYFAVGLSFFLFINATRNISRASESEYVNSFVMCMVHTGTHRHTHSTSESDESNKLYKSIRHHKRTLCVCMWMSSWLVRMYERGAHNVLAIYSNFASRARNHRIQLTDHFF